MTIKGLTIYDGTPTGAGGQALNDNFTALANRSGPLHEHASDPGVNDDSANTGSNGVVYKNSLWRNTTSGHVFICTDDSTGAATWSRLTQSLKDITFCLRGIQTAGTNKCNPIILPYAGIFLKSKIVASVGPTGANFIVDINKNSSTIYGTKLIIVDGQTTGTQDTFVATFAENDILTLDVDQIGSTAAGSNITVVLTTLMNI